MTVQRCPRIILKDLRKVTKTYVSTRGVPTEIRIGHLPKTSLMHSHYSNLLGGFHF